MKKTAIILVVTLIAMGAKAQFGDYGAKVSLGLATVSDDLSTKSPTLGVGVGGYINYNFAKSKSVLAEIFYLQTGVNIVRRGRSFEEVFEESNNLHLREGYCYAWYAQLPVLAGVHMELPVRQPGHVVGVYVGPVLNYGLWGTYNERMINPGYTEHSVNYDLGRYGSKEDRQAFSHINRLDVGATFGISYEYGPLTLSLFVDHGFIAVSKEKDPLRIMENSLVSNSEAIKEEVPTGNNTAYMLSVSYRLGSFSKSE